MLMLGTMGSICWRGMLAGRALEHAICQSQFAKCKILREPSMALGFRDDWDKWKDSDKSMMVSSYAL